MITRTKFFFGLALLALLLLSNIVQAEILPGPPPEWYLQIEPGYPGPWYDAPYQQIDLSGGGILSATAWDCWNPYFQATVKPGTWLVFGPTYFYDEDYDTELDYYIPDPNISDYYWTYTISGPNGVIGVRPIPGEEMPYAWFTAWQAPSQSGAYPLSLYWDASDESFSACGNVMVTPEPGTLALLAAGALPLGLFFRRRRRKA